MTASVQVLIGDAQPMLADALALALSTRGDIEVIGPTPSSGTEALIAIRRWQPEVAVLDYWMEELHVGEAMAMIDDYVRGCKLLITSWSYSSEQIREMLEVGASGFLPKSVTVDELADAIRRAAAGERPVYGERLRRLMHDLDTRWEQTGEIGERLRSLTPKELQVLTLLSLGNLPEEVAKQLSIGRGTVKVHIHNILKKTGARSHTEAVAMARYSGLLLP